MLQSTATAPAGAPASLPHYEVLNDLGRDPIEINARDWSAESGIGRKLVSLRASYGPFNFQHTMSPSQARALAVYLVDCANALDNPADRVIVEVGEGVGHE